MMFDFILFIFCLIGYILSICGFCEKYLHDSRINKKIFAFTLLGIKILINTLTQWLNTPYILNVLIDYMLFIGLVNVFFCENRQKKLFVAAILLLTKASVWNFSCSLFSCFALIAVKTLTKSETVTLDLQTGNIVGSMAYCVVILAISILKGKMKEVFHNKIEHWYLFLSVPLLFIIMIIEVVNWGASNGIMVMSNGNGTGNQSIYYNQFFSHAGICLLTALSMCIAAGLVFGMNKIYVEQKQKEQYRSKVEFYKMLNAQYLQMDRLRHDMKNHILSLHGLYQNKEYEKIGIYLEKMLESGNIGTNHYATGNTAIDALLYNKGRAAEQNSIRWMCDVQIPDNCIVDEFDMCILFGNILDNALNACEEVQNLTQHFICVQSRKIKNCFLLVVKNGTVMSDTKERKQGIGFLNIRETVKKYNGVVNAKIENNIFEISVLIPMGSDAHSMKQTI